MSHKLKMYENLLTYETIKNIFIKNNNDEIRGGLEEETLNKIFVKCYPGQDYDPNLSDECLNKIRAYLVVSGKFKAASFTSLLADMGFKLQK